MGKSGSKLGTEPLEKLKHPNSGVSCATGLVAGGAYTLNEKELRNLCKSLSKDFPDAQLSNILDNEEMLASFLTDIFFHEVEVSDCMQTLFRGNCLASKVMSHCFRTFGSNYLKKLLEPHIRPLIETSSNIISTARIDNINDDVEVTDSLKIPNLNSTENDACTEDPSLQLHIVESSSVQKENTNQGINLEIPISYEIDSTRLEKDGNIYVNQKNLLKLTKQILDSILSSSIDFPPQLNSMCICLRQVLSRKYPDSDANLRAVGTVIFLRFINPAIVSPFESGVIDRQPPPRTLRGLMLVSKILQNIANNVEFSKEEHMLPFNDFVRTQFEPMRKWVSEIATIRNETTPSN